MPNDQPADNKGPGVKLPPPLIFVAFLLLAYGLQNLQPLTLGLASASAGKYLGAIIILISLLALIQLVASYFKAGTSIEPWKPTSQLITSGL